MNEEIATYVTRGGNVTFHVSENKSIFIQSLRTTDVSVFGNPGCMVYLSGDFGNLNLDAANITTGLPPGISEGQPIQASNANSGHSYHV